VLAKSRETFPYEFVIMMGDNLYGSERPQDYVRKFETPYKLLLDAEVPFYATLGNHDDPNQRFYKPFNMNGERYYTFTKGPIRFFVLDSNYMDQEQLKWLDTELSRANERWKMAYFHHPLYSSGARHGSEVDLRRAARAALPQVRGGCRLGRARTLLRADSAAAGHLLFHLRRRGEIA
jgi:3',5'-cyclic AMP phosphodiesterase CpdA